MRIGRSGPRVGGVVVAFLIGCAFFAGYAGTGVATAHADEATKCTTYRAAGKGFEKLELRACKAEDDAGDEGDDADAKGFAIEARSGYDDALKVRVEVVLADGSVEKLDAKIKNGANALGVCKACRELGDIKSLRASLSDGADSGAKDAPEVLHKVAGNMHMEVLARDLRLTDTNAERLKRIASRYFKATRKRLVVTGGTRSPQRQAQLVFDKLKHGDDIIALYENKAAATELRNVYRDAVAKGLKRKATIRAMNDVIEAQIARSVYVSKHLKSGAIDVRSWDMEGALEKALKDAVKAEAGVTLMDERKGPEPHFHLNMH